MFPNPPGPLPLEPYSPGLRERIWWGAASPATAAWAAALGMNLMSSTLVFDDESGDPFHVVQARHIDAFREAWREAGWLVYPALAATGLKILLEDLPRGRPATLFLAFALYGAALIAVARARHRPRERASAA